MTTGPAAAEGLTRTGRLFGSVRSEFTSRFRIHGASDWRDAWSGKALSGAAFAFFATFSSTIALAEVARLGTGGSLGVVEYLLANALAGVVHALAGTQPLLILRPTGGCAGAVHSPQNGALLYFYTENDVYIDWGCTLFGSVWADLGTGQCESA